jgi:16S rRNA processing protein RimM
VGRPHGRDGSFYVDGAVRRLAEGDEVRVGEEIRTVERRAGTDERPLLRLSGVDDREAAAALRGGDLLVPEGAKTPLEEDEWLAQDLVGLQVEGLGRVRRILDAPSCPLLELDDGVLVPLVSDAVQVVDPKRGVIQVDLEFLGMGS